jgi:hypothetical protein
MFFILILFQLKLVITEVMANPKGKTGRFYPEDRNEFVEVFNVSNETIDIGTYKITDFDAIDSIVPFKDTTILIKYPTLKINTTRIPPKSYCLILDPEYTSDSALGGEVQPYFFPESLIVVTVNNTTIGDELQQNDPLMLFSLTDTSTFGTPFDENDTFPQIIKDGYSYERISFTAEDRKENWFPSLSEYGTPGRDNSIFYLADPFITNFSLENLDKNNRLGIFKIIIGNNGLVNSETIFLKIFQNNRYKKEIFLERLSPKKESLLSFILDSLDFGYNKIEIKLLAKNDFDTTNNYQFLELFLFKDNEKFLIVPQVLYRHLNNNIKFEFSLPEKGNLELSIFDLKGKLIKKFKEKVVKKEFFIIWNLAEENLKNGLYLAKMRYEYNNQILEEKKGFLITYGRD